MKYLYISLIIIHFIASLSAQTYAEIYPELTRKSLSHYLLEEETSNKVSHCFTQIKKMFLAFPKTLLFIGGKNDEEK
jgi:hypothetical protein